MKFQQLLMVCSLITCIMYGADNQVRKLTTHTIIKAHDARIVHMAVRTKPHSLITMAANKQLKIWSQKGFCKAATDFSGMCNTMFFAVDNEEKVICQPEGGCNLMLFELTPDDISTPEEGVFIYNESEIHSVALWSQNGKTTLYAGDYEGCVSQWLVDWKENRTSSRKEMQIALPKYRINALLADEQKVYIASTQGVHLWHNKEINKIINDRSLSLAQDKERLYVGRLDGAVHIYAKKAGDNYPYLQCLQILQHNAQAVAALLCQQGKLYASSNNALSVWDCETHKKLAHARVEEQHISNRAPIAVMNNILYRGLSTGEVIAYNFSGEQEKR